MTDAQTWIDAVQASHERFAGLVQPLSADEVEQSAYPSEWSIADTASHLGSQSEIIEQFLDAGLTGGPAPGMDQFHAVWDRWNALTPGEQASQSVPASASLVNRLTETTPEERERFSVPMFGTDTDIAGLAAARLGEHVVHTWDIAVALDPTARIAADAVTLLVDRLAPTVGFAGKAVDGVDPVTIQTVDPDRTFRLTLSPEVTLEPTDAPGPDPMVLPAEALLRLVYGRLDPEHTPPEVSDPRLTTLRQAFPGF